MTKYYPPAKEAGKPEARKIVRAYFMNNLSIDIWEDSIADEEDGWFDAVTVDGKVVAVHTDHIVLLEEV